MRAVQYVSLFLLLVSASLCQVFANNSDNHDTISIDYHIGEQRYVYQGIWQGQSLSVNAGHNRSVIVATLNWPPYIGTKQCQGGWLAHYMSAVLLTAGYNPEFRFLPWARAVRMVELGHADILAPEYEIEPSAPSDVATGDKRLDHLAMSIPFSHTPLHYFSAASSQIEQAPTLAQLPNFSVGVVRGYQNAPQVDKVLDSGKVVVQQAIDDAQNLDLLMNNRVNVIIGDPAVIRTVAARKGISEQRYRVLEPRIIEQSLYFALAKSRPQWQSLQADINEAITILNRHGVGNQITTKLSEQCQSHTH